MADFVTIANLAASSIGEDDQLASPDDDTHLSRTVRAVWDLTRRAAIRNSRWNFAMARTSLPAEALPVAPINWTASYRLPADCLRVIGRLDGRRLSFQVEGKSILADTSGPLNIRYLRDVPEPALWDDSFVMAFAALLGFRIADRITGDRGRKSDAWAAYKDALAEARRCDALENPEMIQEAGSWELARFGFDGGWAGGSDGSWPGSDPAFPKYWP